MRNLCVSACHRKRRNMTYILGGPCVLEKLSECTGQLRRIRLCLLGHRWIVKSEVRTTRARTTPTLHWVASLREARRVLTIATEKTRRLHPRAAVLALMAVMQSCVRLLEKAGHARRLPQE